MINLNCPFAATGNRTDGVVFEVTASALPPDSRIVEGITSHKLFTDIEQYNKNGPKAVPVVDSVFVAL